MGILNWWRRKKAHKEQINALCTWIVSSSKAEFPNRFTVVSSNSAERLRKFEGIAVYLAFSVWALSQKKSSYRRLSGRLQDEMFFRFDSAMREQGAGDTKVRREVRTLLAAFRGRLRAYGEAFNQVDSGEFAKALVRNQVCSRAQALSLSVSMLAEVKNIQAQGVDQWLEDIMSVDNQAETLTSPQEKKVA